MGERKTHAEITAEMQNNDGELCPWLVDGGTCEYCPLGHSPRGKDLGKYCAFTKLAKELESAHKREIDALTEELDAAVKREADSIERVVRDAIIDYSKQYVDAHNDDVERKLKERAAKGNAWLVAHGFAEEKVIWSKDETLCL